MGTRLRLVTDSTPEKQDVETSKLRVDEQQSEAIENAHFLAGTLVVLGVG